MNGLGPDLLCDYFERVHHGKMTRGDSVTFKLPKVKLEDTEEKY